MYLQITTRCNMTCAHCCYSCRPGKGTHADYQTIIDMVSFAQGYEDTITIGGGEPTLHPRFFDVLRLCLDRFDYVWMATNGSNTKAMYRLADIIDGNDYPDCDCENPDYCRCEGGIYQEGKLGVALSQDYFHEQEKVSQKIVDLWTRRAVNRGSGFEIRNVTQARDGVAAQGRAKRTSSGWGDHCVCEAHILKPDGSIKLCGCIGAPTIGDIWRGIDAKWSDKMEASEKYQDERCFQAFRRAKL